MYGLIKNNLLMVKRNCSEITTWSSENFEKNLKMRILMKFWAEKV